MPHVVGTVTGFSRESLAFPGRGSPLSSSVPVNGARAAGAGSRTTRTSAGTGRVKGFDVFEDRDNRKCQQLLIIEATVALCLRSDDTEAIWDEASDLPEPKGAVMRLGAAVTCRPAVLGLAGADSSGLGTRHFEPHRDVRSCTR